MKTLKSILLSVAAPGLYPVPRLDQFLLGLLALRGKKPYWLITAFLMMLVPITWYHTHHFPFYWFVLPIKRKKVPNGQDEVQVGSPWMQGVRNYLQL